MSRISVREVCGESLVFRKDGERLRSAIEQRWNGAEPIEIDLENVSIASVSFFDEALGVLALRHPLDIIKRKVRLLNITDADRKLLNSIVGTRSRERESLYA